MFYLKCTQMKASNVVGRSSTCSTAKLSLASSTSKQTDTQIRPVGITQLSSSCVDEKEGNCPLPFANHPQQQQKDSLNTNEKNNPNTNDAAEAVYTERD